MANAQGPGRWQKVFRGAITVTVCLLILAAAVGGIVLINQTEPTAQRGGATRQSAALVETVVAERGAYRPRIRVLGQVEPARDIVLSPRVSGQIIELDPAFIPGGVVKQGQPLLSIDPADFESTLAMRQSDLRQAEADLAIEQGRQNVAKREFEQLGEQIDPANRSLVLREPQIESIRARVEAAEAAVRQARLNLQRTKITAPFDAKILRRSVNIGSQVAPGDELARLVGTDEYWIMATVPLRHLRWIRFPQDNPADGGEGSLVYLTNPNTWGPDTQRRGQVKRMIGSVDNQTRLARVLISVPDPLARETDGPPLVLGSLLETEIEGQPIDDVVRLNRDYLRQNETVWVMEEGELSIRDTQIIFRDAEYAYIADGVTDGEHVVTTTLATVADGVRLRRAEQDEGTDGVAKDGVQDRAATGGGS